MSNFADVKKLVVPRRIITEGQDFLRAVGRSRVEGMVLWAGKQDEERFVVTELIVPQQRGLRTADGVCVVVDGDELHRLNVYLHESKLRLVAQIHSHPNHAYHSSTDDAYAVATTVGSFSLVVADFAVRPFDLSECAIYRLTQAGKWAEIDEVQSPNEIVIAG